MAAWSALPAQAQAQVPKQPPGSGSALGGRMPLGGPAASAADVADADHKQRADQTAQRLLATARQDVAAGRPEIAQRVLELLVARYPDAPVTAEARGDLYSLYAADKRIGAVKVAPVATRGARPTQASPAPPAVPPAGGGDRTAAASGWRTSTISFRRLQDDLRNGVGDRLFFSAGSAELGSRARALIAAQAEWLLRRPEVTVTIEGHADDAMAGANDDEIAGLRAEAVRQRLMAEGVPAARVAVVAHGARDRVAVCPDSDCAAQNRRAVVQVGVRRSQGGDNLEGRQAVRGDPADVQR